MARFSKNNFKMIIREIEAMEAADQNIWVPIGILEYMFDDYIGYIDNYFHRDKSKRDITELWSSLNACKLNASQDNYSIKKDKNFLKPDPLRGLVWT